MCNLSILVDNVKALSKQRGITMTYLCKRLGKRATFLADVRLGKDNLNDEQLTEIAAILNTTSEYLKGETDDPAPPVSDWMEKIKKDPEKAAIVERLVELDVDTLLKVEQIIDMIKGERS